jgi:cytochrome b
MLRVRVWDTPTRVVHWLMVLLLGSSWWTADHGYMDYHRWSGYWLLGLLAFRLYWGFFGSFTARFANFVRGPKAILQYLKGASSRIELSAPGHNPLGALSVLALLGLMILQVGLGLFAVDVDGLESGPLSSRVSFETGRRAARLHHQVFDLLLAFIVVHVVAVLFYLLFKRQNLIGAMIGGHRHYPESSVLHPIGTLHFASKWRVAAGVVIAAAIVYVITKKIGSG